MPAPIVAAAAGGAARAAGGAAVRAAGAQAAEGTAARTAVGTQARANSARSAGRSAGAVRGSAHGTRQAAEEEVQTRKQNAIAAIQNLFASKGEELDDGDIQRVLRDPPSPPHFPIIIASISVLKDTLDSIDATGVGIILTTFGSIGLGLIIALWMLGKMSGGFWKKAMIKWAWKRYLLMFIVELMPFLKIIPATTILVLMAHYKDKKIVQLLNSSLEILHNHGFKRG